METYIAQVDDDLFIDPDHELGPGDAFGCFGVFIIGALVTWGLMYVRDWWESLADPEGTDAQWRYGSRPRTKTSVARVNAGVIDLYRKLAGQEAPNTAYRLPPAWLYRAGIICATVPLTVGLVVFLAVYQTRSTHYAKIGFWTIAVGSLVVVAGFLMDFAYLTFAYASKKEGSIHKGKVLAWLLIANIPVASVCGYLGIELIDVPNCEFVIQNNSGAFLQNVSISIGIGQDRLGSFSPGDQRAITLPLSGEPLKIGYNRDGVHKDVLLLGQTDNFTLRRVATLKLVILDNNEVRILRVE